MDQAAKSRDLRLAAGSPTSVVGRSVNPSSLPVTADSSMTRISGQDTQPNRPGEGSTAMGNPDRPPSCHCLEAVPDSVESKKPEPSASAVESSPVRGCPWSPLSVTTAASSPLQLRQDTKTDETVCGGSAGGQTAGAVPSAEDAGPNPVTPQPRGPPFWSAFETPPSSKRARSPWRAAKHTGGHAPKTARKVTPLSQGPPFWSCLWTPTSPSPPMSPAAVSPKSDGWAPDSLPSVSLGKNAKRRKL